MLFPRVRVTVIRQCFQYTHSWKSDKCARSARGHGSAPTPTRCSSIPSPKHSQGPITVTVTVEATSVLLEVRDGGPGIAPELLPPVFDRFYRDAATEAAGFGLGLPIAKALVEGLHGVITIESWPEEGSAVRVRLPRLESPAADG